MPATAARVLWRFEAIGTSWQIESDTELPADARARVTALIDRFDREWSRFRADSDVTALARGARAVPLPSDGAAMLDAYAELSEMTGGAVNPLVGRSLESLGYDATYTLGAGVPTPAPGEWRALLDWTGDTLAQSGPGLIDVGALGKGRLVDLVLAALAADVSGDLVVDASGDMAIRGAAVRIGLEHPYDPRRAIGVWSVQDAALCASATNRRAWGGGLHHVLDARTGAPVRTVAATWAVHPEAMRADAIATALFFDGGPEAAAAWGASWVRMMTDGHVEWSPQCEAELFT